MATHSHRHIQLHIYTYTHTHTVFVKKETLTKTVWVVFRGKPPIHFKYSVYLILLTK